MSETTASDQSGRALDAEALLSGGGAGHWVLDPGASSVRFRQKTIWGLVNVKGSFKDLSGEGEIFADGVVTGELVVRARSVETGNRKRDDHLRTADFFDVEHHPEIRATIRRVSLATAPEVNVGGQIEILGQPLPLMFTAGLTEITDEAVTVAAETSFDRDAAGITWNKAGVLRGPTTVDVTLRFTRL